MVDGVIAGVTGVPLLVSPAEEPHAVWVPRVWNLDDSGVVEVVELPKQRLREQLPLTRQVRET
jgi:hypothetical protein